MSDVQKSSSQKKPEGDAGTPMPERGSPLPGTNVVDGDDDAERKVEQGVDEDPNPLAPPTNIQGGG